MDGVAGGRMDIAMGTSIEVKAADKASEIRNINVQLKDSYPSIFRVARGTAVSV